MSTSTWRIGLPIPTTTAMASAWDWPAIDPPQGKTESSRAAVALWKGTPGSEEERDGGVQPGLEALHGITEGALRLLENYPWPGNVRELENVIERAVVLCHGGTIGTGLLDLRQPGTAPTEPGTVRLDEAMDRLEREMILRALDETRQVKARAARLLGVSERSLWYKLRKHGLS